MTGITSDLLHAWRSLTHRPLFALITIATLALGLGATIAMFSVADAVLLRPLPFPNDHELVVLSEKQAERGLTGVSMPAVNDWRALPELSSVAAHETQNLLFKTSSTVERLAGVSVSPEFFATLGVSAALGRAIQPGSPLLDPDRKIVLSDDVWRRHFNGDRDVIGRHVRLENKDYEVVGVMPSGFAYPSGAKFWATLPPEMSMVRDSRDLRFLEVIARMAPDATTATVQTRLSDWKRRIASIDPRGAKWQPQAVSLRDETVGQVRQPLIIVFIGVSFLLLVACCNAAALVLAHGRAKLRDLAVQSALGANRGRLIRQLLIEGFLLSLAGATIAVVVSLVTRDAIVALSENQIPRVGEISIGLRTVFFALGAGILTTLLVALGPALVLTRVSQSSSLQRGSRSVTSSGAGRRVFGPLIAAECALALLLASAAGLLMTSYRHLTAVDSGFRPAQVLTARVAVPLSPEWSSVAAMRRFNTTLLDSLRVQPGVSAAAIVSRLPLTSVAGGTELWAAESPDKTRPALLQLTSEDYFETMGSRIIAGRDFAAADVEGATPVAIINDVLAKQLWGDANPLGRQITYQYMKGPSTVEVVGIVPAMRYNDVTAANRAEIYVTFRQGINTPVSLVVKSAMESAAVTTAVRAAVRAADPTNSVTLNDVSTLDAQMARVLARPRFYLVMVAVFATVAVMLAALGIYGTMMFWIGERWREFGIRIALGARSQDVTALLVRHGLVFAVSGILVGLAGAIASRKLIATLLFEVSPADPAVLATTIALLGGAAVVAAIVPARRVAGVDPVATLRAE